MAAAIMRAGEGKPATARAERAGAEALERCHSLGRAAAAAAAAGRSGAVDRPGQDKAEAFPRAGALCGTRGKAHGFPRARLDRRLKQRLARGTEAIEARVDLHGKTQSEAYAALFPSCVRRRAMVPSSSGDYRQRRQCARGRERARRAQAPSAAMVERLPEFRRYVLGFEDAHHRHGGAGALYLRIRRQRSGLRADGLDACVPPRPPAISGSSTDRRSPADAIIEVEHVRIVMRMQP